MFRIFRHYLESHALLALACEFIIFINVFNFSVKLSLSLGNMYENYEQQVHLLIISFVFTCLITALSWSVGLYEVKKLRSLRLAFPRLIISHLLLFPITLAAIYIAIGKLEINTFLKLLIASLVTLGCITASIAFRSLFSLSIARRSTRILILGTGQRAAKIKYFADANDTIDIVAFLSRSAERSEINIDAKDRIFDLGNEHLTNFIRDHKIDEIVVAVDDRRGFPVAPLLECRMAGITVTDYLSFWERETRKIMIDNLDPSWLIYSDGFHLSTVASDIIKRLVDIAIGLAFFTLTLPLMLLIAVLIKIDSPGPIIYCQDRIGRDGRIFTLYKFRSMRIDAELKTGPQWAAENDSRTTKLGHFIRKTRIDEIPQAFNVLKGDMSFIGPRPERPFFVDTLAIQIPYYKERHRVAPGITGWAQINYPYGASVDDAKEKLAYDLYYIKNYSLMLDFLVLLETIQVVFWPKGVR